MFCIILRLWLLLVFFTLTTILAELSGLLLPKPF
jgi:hypothetical protein